MAKYNVFNVDPNTDLQPEEAGGSNLDDDPHAPRHSKYEFDDSSQENNIVSKEYKRKFISLSEYIKWIIGTTKLKIRPNASKSNGAGGSYGKANGNNNSIDDDDTDSTYYYIIQSRIINNINIETNLEIILKLTTFAGDKVYSVICKNRNLLIKMDKLQ